jgi:biopolymer transport protein TolQ
MNNKILWVSASAALLIPQTCFAQEGGGTMWDMVTGSGPVVTVILLLLVLFSVLTWAIILSKGKSFWEASKQNKLFYNHFWNSTSLSDAFNQSKALSASPLASVFRLGYSELGKVMRLSDGALPPGSMENLRRALARGQSAELTRLGRMLTLLATCANTAPFIGLFGTVWGIMFAFQSIGETGSANLATVAPHISEALVATATGLFAAIPAVVFYNHFNRRLQVLDSSMESFIQDFLNLVERDQIRRKVPAMDSARSAR